MPRNFLLEIGTEEIPAGYLEPASVSLKELMLKQLKSYNLSFESITTLYTPRRLACFITNLIERQTDSIQKVVGPPKNIAFKDGEPTKVAIGFANAHGIAVENLKFEETAKGTYLRVEKEVKGQETIDILSEFIPSIITKISFPKSMKWGIKDLKFARPIRWIVALFGSKIVKFSIDGLTSNNRTSGLRFWSGNDIIVLQADMDIYKNVLMKNKVIVDQNQRKEAIKNQLISILDEYGNRTYDEELLDEVTNLCEYPVVGVGSFNEKFLELPEEVITTVMKKHQKFFPIKNAQSKLKNKFIFIHNGEREFLDNIRRGNERVLSARLSDGKFFYDEDRKTKLIDKQKNLKGVIWIEDLGNYYQKTQRLEKLVTHFSSMLRVDKKTKDNAVKASELCKIDLLTQMVFEFPQLQGIMGRIYAEKDGEEKETAQAITEHYMPRGASDSLPETFAGSILSIAEKIDNIVGCFIANLKPKSSQDPYALRRQALGIIRIVNNNPDWHFSLTELIKFSMDVFQKQFCNKKFDSIDKNVLTNEIADFINQRIKNILEEKEVRYDIVDAILAIGCEDINDNFKRAEALALLRESAGFEELVISFKRVSNIIIQANEKFSKNEFGEPDESLIQEKDEKILWQTFQDIIDDMNKLIKHKEYYKGFVNLSELKPIVDSFFNTVMVMVEDEKLRNNRLAILSKYDKLFKGLADFTKIVIE